MFQIQASRDVESLLRNREVWDSLARGVPFRESAWIGPWWCHFGDDKDAHVLVATDSSGTVCGLLPLYRNLQPRVGRTLYMMGDGDACSDHVSVLAREEDAIEIAVAMGKFLCETAGDSSHGWDLLDLDGIVEGDEPMMALARGLADGGALLHTQSRMSTWYKPADASWSEHLKHHGKTQRRRMRRMSEKIGEGGCVDKIVAETDEQVEELLEAVIDMHQRRWNSVGEPGSYADPKFRQFVLDTAREFCRLGRLYLTALKHEGRFIGGEMNIIGENRIMYSYSAGYDIESRDLEPGRLVGIDVLLQLYRQNLVGLDYMRGDEEYKKRLSTSSRRLLRTRVIAPAPLPRLRHAAWCTSFELKQWVRRRTGRPTIDVLDITLPADSATTLL